SPSRLSRRWLALWIVQVASQRSLSSSADRCSSSRFEAGTDLRSAWDIRAGYNRAEANPCLFSASCAMVVAWKRGLADAHGGRIVRGGVAARRLRRGDAGARAG